MEEYEALWTEEKDEWVLVNTEYGYNIFNRVSRTALCIYDDDTAEAVMAAMREHGCGVYESLAELDG